MGQTKHTAPVRLAFALSLCCSALCVGAPVEGDQDFGFFFSRDRDLFGRRRVRALGPLFERRADVKGGTFTAFRPFVSRLNDPTQPRALSEVLWPLGMCKDFRGETDWRLLNAFGHDFDNSAAGSRHRMSVFPLLFSGRDKDGEGYFALFPAGGTIHEFLGRDRIFFALFPLYACSSVNDNVTRDVLWPIVSWTKGDDVSRFRVFPLYGKSVNEDRWMKRFVLWPIWTSARYDYPDSPGRAFILFPLFGHAEMPDQESWMVLPPLFRWSRSEVRRELNCPWPLFQYSSGDVDKLYLWPFWGRKTYHLKRDAGKNEVGRASGAMEGEIRSAFFMWPIVNSFRAARDGGSFRRFTILPVYFSEATTAPPDEGQEAAGEVIRRYVKFWPLGSYLREGETARLRALDLWPLKRTGGVERNLAPLWTLYSRTRVGKAAEDEVLWGLFRRRNDGQGRRSLSVFPLFACRRDGEEEGTREWSVLGGLFGYRREGLRKTYRLLYFVRIPAGKDDS